MVVALNIQILCCKELKYTSVSVHREHSKLEGKQLLYLYVIFTVLSSLSPSWSEETRVPSEHCTSIRSACREVVFSSGVSNLRNCSSFNVSELRNERGLDQAY